MILPGTQRVQSTAPLSVSAARLDENARPRQARAVHAPPSSKPGGFRGQRPASAGPRARIQSARNVDDRLEAMQRGMSLTVTPPPPPSALMGGEAMAVRGSSVPTGHQLLEQLEILRQANAYMRQQQQAAMLRLASVTQQNEQLEERAAHAEKMVQALSLANRRSHAQLLAVTRELREVDRSATTKRDVRRGAASQAVAALAGALTPAQAREPVGKCPPQWCHSYSWAALAAWGAGLRAWAATHSKGAPGARPPLKAQGWHMVLPPACAGAAHGTPLSRRRMS